MARLIGLAALAALALGVEAVTAASTPDLARVEHHGVALAYDTSLANGVVSEIVAERVWDNEWASAPEHVRLGLDGYAGVNDLPGTAEIRVYPAEAYAQMNPFAAGTMATLRALLADRPDLGQRYGGYLPAKREPGAGEPGEQWEWSPPLLPWSGAATVIHARPAYFNGEGAVGVRYLAQESQNHCWLGSRDVTFYAFQGLTADGAWYVAARLPVRTSFEVAAFVPPHPWSESAFAAACDSANAWLAAALENEQGDAFTPSIDALDSLIGSIRVFDQWRETRS
ncbi:MAG TPA: hypothetical protein VFN74_14340 [Chloroflexota bacterium]|nr:hypothetical protein [Chloroflexota bacterium]